MHNHNLSENHRLSFTHVILHFKSVKCFLWSTNSGSTPTNYTCLTPDVIQRVDKYSGSISEFNKQASDDVQTVVSLYPFTASTNVTSFVIGFTNYGIQVISASYFIVAIGNQPQNDWVDLFQILVPQDATNTLQGGENSVRSMQWTCQASTFIRFSDLTGVTIVSFISSIKVLSASITINQIRFTSTIINSTHFQGQLTATNNTCCFLFKGFYLFYKSSQITSQSGFYQSTTFNFFPSGDHFLNFSMFAPSWGPRWNTKCFLGYWETTYLRDQDFDFRFSNTVKGNFQHLANYGFNSSSTIFRGNAFCLAKDFECGEITNYYDKFTNSCYTAPTCPISTTDVVTIPPPSGLCKLCNETDCLDCLSSDRNYCTQCNITKKKQESLGDCVCIPGFYLPVSDCVLNCTYYLPGCLISSCANQTFCTACKVGYYLNLASNTIQNCVKCSATLPNCYDCSISTFCTVMCIPTCSKCEPSFGITSTSDCVACSTLFNHCISCQNDTLCTQCENNSLTYLHNGTCLKCTDLEPQCNGCSYNGTGITCTSCNAGYYLDVVLKTCILCSTAILDCQQCQVNPTTFKIECTLCSSLFLVDNNLTCQKCKQYKYVTRTCTNVTGCLSSQLINGILVCLGCDATLNFVYNTTTKKCQCNKGFALDQSNSQCIQICGDGIREFMACDDGNTINGDGCSDQCEIEDNFTCTTQLNGSSSCVLNLNISIVYDYTLRQMGENKLNMYFTVSPSLTVLDKVDWKKAISFNFSEAINPSFQYKDGILIITTDYNVDLDGKMMNLTINFDNSIVNSESQIINLEMGAVNGPLSYESESSLTSYKMFNISGLIISLICLFFYLISSYFHKMIGLETIQFIQMIYFIRLISGTSVNSCFYAFNSLKYSNGYNDIFSTSNQSAQELISIPSGFIRLNLKLFFLGNCNLMLIPVGLASIGYIFYSVKKSRSQALYVETKERIHKDLMIIQNRKVEWIYDSLIFSFTLSLLYVIIFSIFLYELSILQRKSLFGQSFIILSYGTSQVVLFFVSGIYCYEVILGIKKYKAMTENNGNVRNEEKSMEHDGNGANHGFHPLYVSFYLFYQLMMIVLMSIMAFIKFNFLIESILGFSALYLVVIILWRPYKDSIHNKAIIFHQSTIIAFILFQLLSKYKVFPTILVNPFLYLILALIILALVLQIIRLYVHRKLSKKLSSLKKDLSNQGLAGTKNKRVKKKLALNPYSYEAQILNLEAEISQPNYSFFSNEKFLHQIMPPDLRIKSKKRVNENPKSIIPIQLSDTKNEMMEQISDDHQFSELQLKKFRLRQQLDIFYENPTPKAYHNL